ncbi:MAG: hypothetical protein IH621_02375 [Krumholzibacteria bacterium]|nr:hypothetical protein [Candidatus Krumholzibacteria bacterium]
MERLGVRFDMKALDPVRYGGNAWRVFWEAVGPEGLPHGTELWEGDTAATLSGDEQVYCIAIGSADASLLSGVRGVLEASRGFRAVAAEPAFTGSAELAAEPLVRTGRFEHGQIGGEGAINARGELAELRRRCAPAEPETVRPAAGPRRTSPRSAGLPDVATLDELAEVLGERFPGRMTPLRIVLTPEELADVAEHCDDWFALYWKVDTATVAELATFVTFTPREPGGDQIPLHGLLRFPSARDARAYCEREQIGPDEWGVRGALAAHFVGFGTTLPAAGRPEELGHRRISAAELWPLLERRRRELGLTAAEAGGRRPWWRFWG